MRTRDVYKIHWLSIKNRLKFCYLRDIPKNCTFQFCCNLKQITRFLFLLFCFPLLQTNCFGYSTYENGINSTCKSLLVISATIILILKLFQVTVAFPRSTYIFPGTWELEKEILELIFIVDCSSSKPKSCFFSIAVQGPRLCRTPDRMESNKWLGTGLLLELNLLIIQYYWLRL